MSGFKPDESLKYHRNAKTLTATYDSFLKQPLLLRQNDTAVGTKVFKGELAFAVSKLSTTSTTAKTCQRSIVCRRSSTLTTL